HAGAGVRRARGRPRDRGAVPVGAAAGRQPLALGVLVVRYAARDQIRGRRRRPRPAGVRGARRSGHDPPTLLRAAARRAVLALHLVVVVAVAIAVTIPVVVGAGEAAVLAVDHAADDRAGGRRRVGTGVGQAGGGRHHGAAAAGARVCRTRAAARGI